jgi:phytol kinase
MPSLTPLLYIPLRPHKIPMPSTDIINELLRKSIHLTSILIILIYAYAGKQAVLTVLMIYLVMILIIEQLRLEHNMKIPLFHFLFREKEDSQLSGHVFFTIGALISISVLSKDIAYASILMTTFGDLSAALVGKTFGRTRIFGKSKSLEGCAAEFAVDFIIAYAFLGSLIIASVMAFTATIVEATAGKIDDNLAIPVFSGASGQAAMMAFPWM